MLRCGDALCFTDQKRWEPCPAGSSQAGGKPWHARRRAQPPAPRCVRAPKLLYRPPSLLFHPDCSAQLCRGQVDGEDAPRCAGSTRDTGSRACVCIRGHALVPPAAASPCASPTAGSPPHPGSPTFAGGRRPVRARKAKRGGWAGAVTPRCWHELSPGEQPNLGTAGSCPRSWFWLCGLHRPTRLGRFSAVAF